MVTLSMTIMVTDSRHRREFSVCYGISIERSSLMATLSVTTMVTDRATIGVTFQCAMKCLLKGHT